MDMSKMDHGSDQPVNMANMNHSQHQMPQGKAPVTTMQKTAMDHRSHEKMDMSKMDHSSHGQMNMSGMDHSAHGQMDMSASATPSDHSQHQMVVSSEKTTSDIVQGWANAATPIGQKALTYADLKSLQSQPERYSRPAERELVIRLGGTMERYIWTIDGKKFSDPDFKPLTVRYGERILFQYTDEETNEDVVIRVSEYIRSELERDDLTFYTPLFKSMMDEAADRCRSEGFIANRYFLAHPDPNVSRLAANLISEKYQLSKYHTKYRELEQEEDKLDQLVIRELYAFKDAYVLSQIKEIQAQIKSMQNNEDMDQVFELMKKLTRLNEIKNILSKELGERIILKM
jgi:hypothetical protein